MTRVMTALRNRILFTRYEKSEKPVSAGLSSGKLSHRYMQEIRVFLNRWPGVQVTPRCMLKQETPLVFPRVRIDVRLNLAVFEIRVDQIIILNLNLLIIIYLLLWGLSRATILANS